jgi:prevent-host-death family protein
MCYVARMERIAVRELRNQASQVVRRARSGERLIITVDGVPAAQLGPISTSERETTIQELLASGAVIAPRVRTNPPPAMPIRARAGYSSAEVLRRLRDADALP